MNVAGAFGFVVIMLAIGHLLRRHHVVPESAPDTLNQIVLYVCLPASVLLYASRLQIDRQVLLVASVPWLLLPLGAGVVLAIARSARWSAPILAVMLLALPLGNTSFLGYPLVSALIGDQALPHAVIYDQLGSFLILSTYGLWIISQFGHGGRPSVREVALRVFRFPAFIALIVALTVMPAQPPEVVGAALKRVSDALLPIVALAVGMQIELRLPRDHLAPLLVGLALKLIGMPALAYGLTYLMHIEGDARAAVVLEAGMPSMITAMALAGSRGLAPPLAAGLVGYGIVASGITLPLLLWWVQ